MASRKILSLLRLHWIVDTSYFSIAIESMIRFTTIWVGQIGSEEVCYLTDVVWLQFLSIYIPFDLKIQIQKIFSPIVLVHTYIFQLELDFDAVIGKEARKFNELVPEVFNKFIVDITDPSLKLDRYVLEHKVNWFLLFKHRLDLDHMLIFQFTEDSYFFHQPILLLNSEFIDLSHQYSHHFAADFLALTKGIVVLHGNDHLLRHDSINKSELWLSFHIRSYYLPI